MLRAMQERREAAYRRVGRAGVAGLLLWAGAAHAEPGPPDETERWVPSFSLRSGVTAHDLSGAMSSLVVSHFEEELTPGGPPVTLPANPRIVKPTITVQRPASSSVLSFISSDQPVFPPAESDQLVMNPWVGGSIEIMTPGLQFLPTRPRFFVHGDVQRMFGTERSLARTGDPSDSAAIGLPPGFLLQWDQVAGDDQPGVLPPQPPLNPDGSPANGTPPLYAGTLLFPTETSRARASETLVSGLGTKMVVTEDDWAWGGGAGVAFTFELFGRRLRVKPSIEYQRRTLTIESTANSALPSNEPGTKFSRPNPDPPPARIAETIPPQFNIVQLASEEEFDIDGLGPGLEIEMDTWQVGPVMLSLYLSGQAYKVLGDTELAIGGDTSTPCNFTDGSNLEALCQQTGDFDFSAFNIDFSRQRQPDNTNLAGLGVNDIYGDFEFEIDPWYYQAGVGLRFRGVPDTWIPRTVRNFGLAKISTPSWLPW